LQNIVQMFKSFSYWVTSFPRPRTAAWPWTTLGAPLAASGNESLYFSLRLCFSNDVYSETNSCKTRKQRLWFMAGRHWHFGPDLPCSVEVIVCYISVICLRHSV